VLPTDDVLLADLREARFFFELPVFALGGGVDVATPFADDALGNTAQAASVWATLDDVEIL
jgi:hypothetical protein